MVEKRKTSSPKYDTSGLAEDSFEPGSRGRVLANLRGIKSRREMEALETREYHRLVADAMATYDEAHPFTANDLCDLHRRWLGTVYSWAGAYRSVNIGKGGFQFAASVQVPRLMAEFERKVLSIHTPCHADNDKMCATALAIVHVELILVHPFREGNGRLARLLSVLMGMQAGLPILHFSHIEKGKSKEQYFAAIRAGMDMYYSPMEAIFAEAIRRAKAADGQR